MNNSQTLASKLEQGRVEFAYNCAEKEKEELKEKVKEYKSYSKKISSMILTNGLGQTLAFVKAKSKKEKAYELLYEQTTEYFRSNFTVRIKISPDQNDLLEWVISCDSQDYRYITNELLAFLNWLRRFAEGMIKEEEEQKS